MRYSEDVVEEVRLANDIVDIISEYTSLKQKGNNYFGLCPFHKENTPSFSVSSDMQVYHCFGCGASGNVFSFVMQKENYSFLDAVEVLAEKANITLLEKDNSLEMQKLIETKNILQEIHTKVGRFYYSILNSNSGNSGIQYLGNRQISKKVRTKFGIGYSLGNENSIFDYLMNQNYDMEYILKSGLVIKSKNGKYFDRFNKRIMFPIFDVYNKVIGFGGRTLGDSKIKYLNSPDTLIFDKSKNLYGLNYARKENAEYVIIVEGYMDVISLYQNNIKNVVAVLGTSLTTGHAKLLRKYFKNAILLFDNDQAGQKATLRAIPILTEAGINVKILQLPNANDPDDFIKEFGREAFVKILSKSKNHIIFQVICLRKAFDINDPAQKIQFINRTVKLLADLPTDLERDIYIREISKLTNVSYGVFKNEVDKHIDPKLDHVMKKQYVSKNKPIILSNKQGEKGANEAKESILYTIANKPGMAKKMKEILPKEEFNSPFYEKLYELIYMSYDKEQKVCFAEIISHFDNLEDQRVVSSIANNHFKYEDEISLIRAINDQIRIIKVSYFDNKIANAKDEGEIQKFMEMKKKLKNLYIKGLDG